MQGVCTPRGRDKVSSSQESNPDVCEISGGTYVS